MRYISIVGLLMIFVAGASALLVGETNPPLNRPEVVTVGGAYGANVNIDTLTGNGTVVLVSFGYEA